MYRVRLRHVLGSGWLILLTTIGCTDASVPDNTPPTPPPDIAGNASNPGMMVSTDCGLDCSEQSGTGNDPAAPLDVTGNAGDQSASQSTDCGSESFRALYLDIFMDTANSCTAPSCHGRAMRLEDVGNLDLSTPETAYAELVGVASDGEMCAGRARVVPGDPQGSLLVSKLRDATVDCGLLMPAGAPIDDASLMRIVNWISAGACNN